MNTLFISRIKSCLKIIKHNFITSPKLNLWKTIYVNFKTQSVKDAYRLPILVYGRLKIDSLGVILINCPLKIGIIRIGNVNMKSNTVTRLNSHGCIIFNGQCEIWGGVYCELAPKAKLEIGKHVLIGENVRFLLRNRCLIGNYARIAYDSQFLDTDFHYLINIETGQIKNNPSEIIIGNYNWIGNKTTIKKGTITSDYTIVAAPNALLTKDYTNITSESPVLGGAPAKEIAHGVRRIFNVKSQLFLDNYFRYNSEPYMYKQGDLESFCNDHSIP